jgi:hypothetical protein
VYCVVEIMITKTKILQADQNLLYQSFQYNVFRLVKWSYSLNNRGVVKYERLRVRYSFPLMIFFCPTSKFSFCVKVKQSRYRPGVAQKVPRS